MKKHFPAQRTSGIARPAKVPNPERVASSLLTNQPTPPSTSATETNQTPLTITIPALTQPFATLSFPLAFIIQRDAPSSPNLGWRPAILNPEWAPPRIATRGPGRLAQS